MFVSRESAPSTARFSRSSYDCPEGCALRSFPAFPQTEQAASSPLPAAAFLGQIEDLASITAHLTDFVFLVRLPKAFMTASFDTFV